MGYIRAHWRGEHSFAHSYWINGFLISAAIIAASRVLVGGMEAPHRPNLALIALIVLQGVVWAGITIWQLVGILRSAENHKQRTGRKIWANIAIVMVLFGFTAIAKVAIDYGKIALATYQALTGQFLAEYSIEIVGTNIHLNGYINYQVVDEINKMLGSQPKLNTLVINSPGGFIGASIELGYIVQRKNITVIVDGECHSGCTLPLVASPRPTIVPGSVIGFHRGGGVDVKAFNEGTNRWMEKFYASHGVSQSVIRKALSTPYEKIWTPSLGELVNNNIIMYVFDLDTWQFVIARDWCAARPTEC